MVYGRFRRLPSQFMQFFFFFSFFRIVQNPQKKPEIFIGSAVTDCFKLRRPKGITFNWSTVIQMHFVIFELELICSGNALKPGTNNASDTTSTLDLEHEDNSNSTSTRILIKGQMRHMVDIDAIVFLCSPLLVYSYSATANSIFNSFFLLGSTVLRNCMEWVYF